MVIYTTLKMYIYNEFVTKIFRLTSPPHKFGVNNHSVIEALRLDKTCLGTQTFLIKFARSAKEKIPKFLWKQIIQYFAFYYMLVLLMYHHHCNPSFPVYGSSSWPGIHRTHGKD